MLVLRRGVGEEVVVARADGTELGRIMVVDVRRGLVRLGFTFPREYEVDRLEVHRLKFNPKERGHAEGTSK